MVVVPFPASPPPPPSASVPPAAVPALWNVPKEIAMLRVNGIEFMNWTSVHVEARVTEAFPQFAFEVTEESPMPLTFSAQQFLPGAIVQAFLGGQSVLFGYISERHVGFDANQHGIKLIGVGDTFDLVNSCPPIDKLGGHDGKSWSQLAQDLMAHLGIQLHKVGAVDDTPFQNIQVQPGETIMQVLERYGKMRSIVIGSKETGGLVAIGEHAATPSGDIVEGGNILRANCVIRDANVYKKIFAIGQNISGDGGYGDKSNKQLAYRQGSSTRERVITTVADVADTQHGTERRADMEKLFTEGTQLEAQITVQGWFKDNNQSDQLWRAGEYYTVNSPSMVLNGVVLGCAGCTYEQNQGGSTTTLTMVDPEHMNGKWNWRPGSPQAVALAREQAAQFGTGGPAPGGSRKDE